jgi:YYY domain-containing protein
MVVEDCYRVASPGMFEGDLGFELVKIFQSNPRLGPFELNDQFAEEAFTVYDHPKVLIFRKSEDYDPDRVRQILGSVDFSKVIRIPPMRARTQPADLLLPDYRLAEQRQGGTWSELFNTQALHNRFQPLGVLVWYLSLSLLGWIVYPLIRLAMPGLADRGYPAARISGLLLLSYLVWLAGSSRIPFTRPTILVTLLLMVIASLLAAIWQRHELRQELGSRWKYFLAVEGLTLAFFLAFLLVRLGNPDLWHPWKGGEKPMDFSYFNAVLKSTSFPPFDPWYAGGYLNYYYYGFMLVGVLVKLLGIVPSFAYNLILPTLFCTIAMGAFSVAWNLYQASKREGEATGSGISPYIPALAGAFGAAVLGNLGTIRMIYQGYQRIAAPGGVIEGANLIVRLAWAVRGFLLNLQGVRLPYGVGDWYWIPSRAIPAGGDVEPITEFPYFTVLYGDPHAHLFSLPITLLALGFCVGIVLGGARWKSWLGGALAFFFTALAIGALRPTNTWDFPPYLALGLVAVGYALWRNYQLSEKALRRLPFLGEIPQTSLKLLAALCGMALLGALSFLLFQPYAEWYALGYTKVALWKGVHTPFTAYLTHWGLFLFLIVTWMVWETRDWMAKTPMSALRGLYKQRITIQALLLIFLLIVLILLFLNVYIAWFVLPLAAWAGILLLRPSSTEARRIVLFLIGTGLTLTLMVEVIVLVGDIGRMNTVFKFYLQVWTLFAISAAVALGWLLEAISEWKPAWRWAWQASLGVLVAGAALFTFTATAAKVDDTIAPNAPLSLDGMAFMPYSTYADAWGTMDLSQDYRAIRWMQENVAGSPVIVEANLRNLYRWGSRFSIYTGLPGVVGWEWHEQQQRTAIPSSWVTNRIMEVDDFYLTTDWQAAANFLHKYDVRYIIVGQQERGHYPGPGLDKFEDAEGILWQEVYRDEDTVIYQVLDAD